MSEATLEGAYRFAAGEVDSVRAYGSYDAPYAPWTESASIKTSVSSTTISNAAASSREYGVLTGVIPESRNGGLAKLETVLALFLLAVPLFAIACCARNRRSDIEAGAISPSMSFELGSPVGSASPR